MAIILIELHNNVSVLKLNRSITNPLNLQLINEMTDIIQKAKEDSAVNSLVLCSTNEKFFSIGFDIPELFELKKEDFMKFYQAFNQLCISLYTLPKPTIAALTGHAVAGGTILAICCDYRIIAEGKKWMGFNEVKLAVPVPYPADCILKNIVGPRTSRDLMYYGEYFQSYKLLQIGLVDEVLPLEQVLPKSIEKAKALGSLPHKAFAMIKRNRTEKVEKQILRQLEEKERFFVDCWYSEEGRIRLKEALKKF